MYLKTVLGKHIHTHTDRQTLMLSQAPYPLLLRNRGKVAVDLKSYSRELRRLYMKPGMTVQESALNYEE